jgi:uncharacterized protein (DUF2147 family)
MKGILLPLIATALAYGTNLARAEDPTGLWRTQDGTYQYRIEHCDKTLCVFLAWVADNVRDVNNPDPAKQNRRVIGIPLVTDGAPDGPNRWKGHGYWFRNGNTYAGSTELVDNHTLKVSGCILGGLICGSTTLYRMN